MVTPPGVRSRPLGYNTTVVEPSRTIAARYELGEVVGHGGMAVVHRAHDRVLDRPVAVKLLRRGAASGRVVERFRAEARRAGALAHPNTVPVYDSGEDGGVHYLVMELVEGRSLAQALDDGVRFGVREAVAVIVEVCAALDAAHRQGIVHRDVKPGNILLADDGRVRVTDFGIARSLTDPDLTETRGVLGTAAYLAPEQAAGQRVDGRADVYATACVLVEMVTGRPPFVGDTAVAVAHQQVSAVPPSLAELGADVPPALEEVVARALAKDPAARPATPGELAAELLAAVRSAPGPAGTAPGPALPPGARYRRPLALAGVAVLGLLVLLAVTGGGDADPEAAAAAGAVAEQAADEPPVAAPEEPVPPAEQPPTAVSVGAAVGAVLDELDAAIAAGAVDARDAKAVSDKLADVVKEHGAGKPGKALEKLEDAMEELDDLVEDGDIDPARADAIRLLLSQLALALGGR